MLAKVRWAREISFHSHAQWVEQLHQQAVEGNQRADCQFAPENHPASASDGRDYPAHDRQIR